MQLSFVSASTTTSTWQFIYTNLNNNVDENVVKWQDILSLLITLEYANVSRESNEERRNYVLE